MNAPTGDNEAIMRARELEIEVARLNAELETLRGEGEPTDIAARFLTMAASTVDQAMEQARSEADELAAEVSAAAEARRDEATRIADEAEARTESLRAEAANHEQVVEQARTEAADITAAAEAEADALIQAERQRVADEIERLSSVREALESERGALENYHDELKRRVQELAESMVAFMTTEPPLAAVGAIEDLTAPELAVGTAADAETETETAEVEVDDEPMVEAVIADPEIVDESAAEFDTEPEPEITDDSEIADDTEIAAEAELESDEDDEPVAEIVETEDEVVAELVEDDTDVDADADDEPVAEFEDDEPTVSTSPIDWSAGAGSSESEPVVEDEPVSPFAAFGTPVAEQPVAAEVAADEPAAEVSPFGEAHSNPFAEPAVPAKPVEPSAFYDNAAPAAAPSFADMMSPAAPVTPPAPAGPPVAEPVAEPAAETGEFGGVPVVERETTASGLPTRRSRMGGLFGRGSAPAQPTAEETPAEEPATAKPAGGLFGTHGARLIEQTSPEDLAAALAEESDEDERFRSFIDGDDDGDKSRDWLLRPEQS